jgi:hypothetical protein
MNGEYQWWLLAVVAAAAGGIFWLLRGTIPRREVDVETPELAAEARWISRRLQEMGTSAPADTVEQILELHRSYLDEPPSGAPLETELMPLPEEPPLPGASSAPGYRGAAAFASQREQTRASRRERARRRQQAQPAQRELPPAQIRESPPAQIRESPPAQYRESRTGS